MKRFRLNSGLVFASWAILLIFGCHKKKPQIQPEQIPPTLLSQVPIKSEQPAQQAPQTQPDETANTKPAEKPRLPVRRTRHTPSPKKPEPEKPAPVEEAKNISPPKVVIQEGGANPGNGQPPSGASKDDSASTQQLVESTRKNLDDIRKRQLSADENSMVLKIEDYLKQSQAAINDGDNVRAHSLAEKAHLLSSELVKP